MKNDRLLARIINRGAAPLQSVLAGLVPKELKGLARSLMEHIDLHIDQGNPRAARRLFAESFGLLDHVKDLRLSIELHKKNARFLAREESLADALEILEKLRRSLEGNGLKADIYVEMGILCDEQGSKKKAIECFRKAMALFRKDENRYNEAVALFNISSVLFDIQRTEESLEACEEALSLGEGEDDSGNLRSHLFHQRANLYDTMGNKEKAAEDYRKALMEYQVQKDLIKQSDIIYKLGSYLTEEGKARESLRVLGRALDIKVQLDAGEALAKYFFARGLILAGAGLKGEARESFRQGSDHAAGSASERIGRLCRFYQSRLDGEAHGPAEPAAVPSVLHRYHAQGGDGARIERYCEKPQPESFVVDRKFLFYLLRRMARMYRQLQDQENFLQLYTQTWCVERKLKGRSFSKDDNQ